MSDLFPVAGATIYIGPAMAAPSDDVAAGDFSATTWTEIADWTNCGTFGDSAALITTPVISRGRDVKQKGTKNAGQMQNTFAINSGDAGQIALIAAAETNQNFPFKIEWDDAAASQSHVVTVTCSFSTSTLRSPIDPCVLGEARPRRWRRSRPRR